MYVFFFLYIFFFNCKYIYVQEKLRSLAYVVFAKEPAKSPVGNIAPPTPDWIGLKKKRQYFTQNMGE